MDAEVDIPDGVLGQLVNDEAVVFLTADEPVATFGRGSHCAIRFGHDPVDTSVSRTAGQVMVVDGRRLAVENTSGQIAFDVKCPDQPMETVRPGALYSPPTDQFEISYAGSMHVHLLRVRSFILGNVVAPTSLDTMTTPLAPFLTERQWRVLDAYVAPLRDGGTVPATHAEVARELGWSMSLIRLESNEIWSSFLLRGIPMRDLPDKRDAIVDAVIRHRLTRETAG